MPHLQPQIPQRVEDRFDHLFGPCGLLPRRKEADIDIGIGRHLAAPIAADGDQHDPLGGGWIGVGVQSIDSEIVEQTQELIDQERLPGGGFQPARGMLREPSLDFAAARIERGLQALRDRLAQLSGIRFDQRRQVVANRAPIDDRAALRKAFDTQSHGAILSRARANRHVAITAADNDPRRDPARNEGPACRPASATRARARRMAILHRRTPPARGCR